LGKIDLLEDDKAENLPMITVDMLKPGTLVYITTLKQKGTVLSASNQEVTVQLGIMKVTVRWEDCRILEEKIQKPNTVPVPKSILVKVQDIARQIDLRGVNVEEGEILLDKYLDDAVLAGLHEVIVIHGKGTGALRKGIREYLKNHPYVKEMRIGELDEGGNGTTIVKLS
jgi:DNA mismatch repair protein MutS2